MKILVAIALSLLGPVAFAQEDKPERELVRGAIADAVKRGIAPEQIAERTLRAIREDRFYVLSDDDWRRIADGRCEDVRLGRNPTLRVPQLEPLPLEGS